MESITEVIGCDLGDKRSEVCILKANGGIVRPKAIKTTVPAMRAFFTREAAHVVIEVGTHSRWMSQLLAELGHKVTVANPRRVLLISKGNTKTDKKDAELLARLGRADTALLAPVQHRGSQAHIDLAVTKARDVLVRCRTKLVLHARSVVKAFGERLPACSAESFHKRAPDALPSQLRPALQPILATLEAIDVQIREHDQRIAALVERYPDVEILSQPTGVGSLTALVYILTIEDKSRFKKSRMAGAFLGLKPKRDQSGKIDKQLGITKAGDTYVRRLLVGSANYILGPFGPDSDLRRWGLALAARGGAGSRQRAKVAVARKLAVLLHRLWVTGEIYRPLGYRSEAA